ncbi:MAG TPA: hypothetical protein VGM01_07615 [Ktedonobacteraceae bacterium]|jgi:hypothetical protein
MAKKHQQRPAEELQGRNQPEKSTVHPTDSPKKVETYRAQAQAHENTARMAPSAGVSPTRVAHPEITAKKQNSRFMMSKGERRSGRDSNAGPSSQSRDSGLRARDIKGLYGKLADLTNDELDALVIVPLGERLEQGAKYIDLQHLERGEFVAMADMLSDEDHSYVPKKQTDYVLWNRLNQVSNPARLDEPDEQRG